MESLSILTARLFEYYSSSLNCIAVFRLESIQNCNVSKVIVLYSLIVDPVSMYTACVVKNYFFLLSSTARVL